jgi:hypothetical protein
MKTFLIAIAVLLLTFVMGAVAGYSYAEVHAAKAAVKSAVVAEHKTVVAAAHAQVVSAKIDDHIAKTDAVVVTAKKVAHRRIAAQVKKQIAAEQTSPSTETHDEAPSDPVCGHFYLDRGTVRMLNAARLGTAPDSAAVGDDASDSAPALCVGDFVDSDFELTKAYNDLAERHNALVDAVEQFQKEQRERMGIKEDAVEPDGVPASAPISDSSE